MVQGAFWDLRRTNLYIIDRDFESKKHRYSANSYIEVLDAEVKLVFDIFDLGYLFIQDNASIYTAYKVRNWFSNRGISCIINWPPYSPDLNPIKYIQQYLKTRVFKIFPEVIADKSETEYARQRLESCLQAAWDTLEQRLFNKLYISIYSKMEAYITAGGWHTKY